MKNCFIKNFAVTFFGLLTVLLCSNFKILEEDEIPVNCGVSASKSHYCHSGGYVKIGCVNSSSDASCGRLGGSSSSSNKSPVEELPTL